MNLTRQQFIDKYSADVIAASCGTGIFPSVTMAQMIIESADSNGVAGNGITFREANNAFGIKQGVGWTGPVKSFNTPNDGKPVSVFRVYPSIRDSIIDHTDFLIKNSRYKAAGVFDAKTPEEQTQALANAGYAESSTYGQALRSEQGLRTMINLYDLKKLDEGCKKKSVVDIILMLVIALIIFGVVNKVLKGQDKFIIIIASLLIAYYIYFETPAGEKIYSLIM